MPTTTRQPPEPHGLLASLVRGRPGHPAHPPLTDVTVGCFTLAGALGVIGAAGGLDGTAGPAMWLALIGGLVAAVPTAVTGLADWLVLERGSRRRRTATLHLTAMVTAVVVFAAAAWLQHSGYRDGTVETAGLVATLAGLVALGGGGWLGGTLVYAQGTRVVADDRTDAS